MCRSSLGSRPPPFRAPPFCAPGTERGRPGTEASADLHVDQKQESLLHRTTPNKGFHVHGVFRGFILLAFSIKSCELHVVYLFTSFPTATTVRVQHGVHVHVYIHGIHVIQYACTNTLQRVAILNIYCVII